MKLSKDSIIYLFGLVIAVLLFGICVVSIISFDQHQLIEKNKQEYSYCNQSTLELGRNISILIHENAEQKDYISYLYNTSLYWYSKSSNQDEYYSRAFSGCKSEKPDYVFCKDCSLRLICTNSMLPLFSCDSTLYFCDASGESVTVGDIIMFNSPEYTTEELPENLKSSINFSNENYYTLHLVVDVTPQGYVTKGINNGYSDSYIVPFSSVKGKLYRIDG